jgi:hypothetical protein
MPARNHRALLKIVWSSRPLESDFAGRDGFDAKSIRESNRITAARTAVNGDVGKTKQPGEGDSTGLQIVHF